MASTTAGHANRSNVPPTGKKIVAVEQHYSSLLFQDGLHLKMAWNYETFNYI